MNNPVDPSETLLKMAEALGLGPDDLTRLATQLSEGTSVPTVAEYYDKVVTACPPKSLPTYGCHFKRLNVAMGDVRLDRVTTLQLEQLRDQIIANAARQKVERAIATGRPLRSYQLDSHGYGAGENAVRAFRFFLGIAVKENLIASNPAKEVKVPKRRPGPERPLDVDELEEVGVVRCSTGDDPELDELLFEFHRKTAAPTRWTHRAERRWPRSTGRRGTGGHGGR